mmetsp:Transcript_20769/g.62111  ORF Transcript_20769/g.62111 Transcript_20769/m.62111 type:complete len:259 (-) Transcript_20769:332-1108(-)
MSSLANAVKRRTHKERSQPAARKKYGLLEKHKDYVERAKNFHKKDATIKALKRKAEDRNPDEFYFAMQKARTKDGVHKGALTVANKYSQEELRLMKTQDVKYLARQARVESEKLLKLQSSLHLIGVKPKERKHTVFVESHGEMREFKPEEYFDTPAELLDRDFNRPKTSQLAEAQLPEASGRAASAALRKASQRTRAAYAEMLSRSERQTKVARAAQRMAYAKEVMGNGRKRKLSEKELVEGGGANGAVFKWKRERKK